MFTRTLGFVLVGVGSHSFVCLVLCVTGICISVLSVEYSTLAEVFPPLPSGFMF